MNNVPDFPMAEEVRPEEALAGTSRDGSNTSIPKHSSIRFPEECLVGSIGEFARVMSQGSEVPPEFFFAAGLTMVGAIAATKLRLPLKFPFEPRLYTVLLGESYRVKKSTALNGAVDFFGRIAEHIGYTQPITEGDIIMKRAASWSEADHKAFAKGKFAVGEFGVINGSPGSGEGLMRRFKSTRSIVLALDELKMLVDKAAITGSSLLSAVTSLFEKTAWEAPIKSEADSSGCHDAHLSIIGCCTTETYEHIWTREALAIGLTNRLFVITSDARAKQGFPREGEDDRVARDGVQRRIEAQLARLPLTIDITPEAEEAWNAWYAQMPETESARRLEIIGFRLLALVALTTDKTVIDVATVDTVCRILDYEYSVRVLTDPIDADKEVAKLEEKIRRVLDRFPEGLDPRSIRQKTHADRVGLWAFEAAMKNLTKHGDIRYDIPSGVYLPLAPVAEAPAVPTPAPAAALLSPEESRARYAEYKAWLKSIAAKPQDHSFFDWLEQRRT